MDGLEERLPALTDVQWELMELVWERGECSVGEAWRTLSSRRNLARNTVQTLLARLEDKGWLAHREQGGAHVFAALMDREAAQQYHLRHLLEVVFHGEPAELLAALFQQQAWPAAEVELLHSLVDFIQFRVQQQGSEPITIPLPLARRRVNEEPLLPIPCPS